VHISAQGPHLRNDLYCVKWDAKLYYTIPYRLRPVAHWLCAATDRTLYSLLLAAAGRLPTGLQKDLTPRLSFCVQYVHMRFYPSLRQCWLGNKKGIWPVKKLCWYVGGSDLTGALHTEFLLSPLPPPLSLALAAEKSRMV